MTPARSRTRTGQHADAERAAEADQLARRARPRRPSSTLPRGRRGSASTFGSRLVSRSMSASATPTATEVEERGRGRRRAPMLAARTAKSGAGQQLHQRVAHADRLPAVTTPAAQEQPAEHRHVVARPHRRSQAGQCAGGRTTDSPRGTRQMTTLRKEPTTRPSRAATAARAPSRRLVYRTDVRDRLNRRTPATASF